MFRTFGPNPPRHPPAPPPPLEPVPTQLHAQVPVPHRSHELPALLATKAPHPLTSLVV